MQTKIKKFNGIFSIVVLLVAWIFWQSHQQPDPGILAHKETSLGFSPQYAHQSLLRLFKNMPAHPVGSPANKLMRDRLVEELRALGYQTQLDTHYVCSEAMNCGYVTNLVGYLNEPADRNAILLNVHYDSVVSGPGVADNGANLANALEIARLYKEKPGQNPLVILFSDGEEIDALGSAAFVQQPLAKKIAAVINLEARGTNGRSLMFETSIGSAPLIELLENNFTGVKTSSFFAEVYNYLPNQSDFTNFAKNGIAGYNFAFIGSSEDYHTEDDSLDSLNVGSMFEQGTAAWAVIHALTHYQDIQSIQNSREVKFYTDLAGVTILSWSPTVSMVLISLVLILTVYIFFFGRSDSHSRFRILGGALAALISIVLGIAACYGIMTLIVTLQPVELPWNNYPFQSHLVIWVLSVALGAMIYDLLTRKHNLFEQVGGITLYFVLIALILVCLAPGASYLYLLPLLPGVLLLVLYKLVKQYWLLLSACAVLAVFYALLSIDLSYLIEQAMELGAIGMILPLFLAPVGMLLVVLANTSVLERKAFTVSYAAAGLAVAFGLIQIAQSVEQPVRQNVNLIHFQNDETAYRQLGVTYKRLAPPLKASFEFRDITAEIPMYKRYRRSVVLSAEKQPTQRWSTVERADLPSGERQLAVTVLAGEVHHYVKLKLPADLVISSVTINGKVVSYQREHTLDAEGYSVLTFYGDEQRNSEIVLNYQPTLKPASMLIDEEVSEPAMFSTDKLYVEYQKYYKGQNKGNRAIFQYDIAL